MTHDVDKAQLANKIALAIGAKRPLDYDSRSTRRGVETGLIETFERAKERVSKYGDVNNKSVCDIITTDIRLAIIQGRKPLVDIVQVRQELENLDRKYTIKQNTPTSGRRGSSGQKSKQLALIAEKIKPLRTLSHNYPCGLVLFDLTQIEFPKKEIPKPKPNIIISETKPVIQPIPIIPVLPDKVEHEPALEDELKPEPALKFSVPIALSIAGLAYLLTRRKRR